MLATDGEIPLFNGEEPTDYTKGAMDFLQDFERQRRSTDEWVAIVNQYDLLEEKSVTFTPTNADGSQGETVKIADYLAISEEKLNQLTDAQFLDLKNKGALAAIYAHLVSLLQWQKLVQRTLRIGETAVANA